MGRSSPAAPDATPNVTVDRKLVERCLTGNAAALQCFVETYQSIVFGLCYRMTRHREDAEDVTQESLVRAIHSLRSWDSQRPLRPWIMAIAANRCRTYLARQAKLPRPAQDLTDVPDLRRPDRDSELADELQLALQQLRPEYRMVVVMYHEQELPYEEISEAIGRPIGTVRTWLHRARAELARILARRSSLGHVAELSRD